MKQFIFGLILLVNVSVVIYLVYDIFYLGNWNEANLTNLMISGAILIIISVVSLAFNVFITPHSYTES